LNRFHLDFKAAGDKLYLVGQSRNDINSSEYLHKICGVEFSPVPHFDLDEEFNVQQVISTVIKKGLIESAHDVSEGGLFITLCEAAFNRNLGFDAMAGVNGIRKDAYWFGEAQSRIVVSVSASKEKEFKSVLQSAGVPFEALGEVTSGAVKVDGQGWGNIQEWKMKYDDAISDLLAAHESEHALSAL